MILATSIRRTKSCQIRSQESLGSEVGCVMDNLRFRIGSPIVTAVDSRIYYDHQWLRTWNRFVSWKIIMHRRSMT